MTSVDFSIYHTYSDVICVCDTWLMIVDNRLIAKFIDPTIMKGLYLTSAKTKYFTNIEFAEDCEVNSDVFTIEDPDETWDQLRSMIATAICYIWLFEKSIDQEDWCEVLDCLRHSNSYVGLFACMSAIVTYRFNNPVDKYEIKKVMKRLAKYRDWIIGKFWDTLPDCNQRMMTLHEGMSSIGCMICMLSVFTSPNSHTEKFVENNKRDDYLYDDMKMAIHALRSRMNDLD